MRFHLFEIEDFSWYPSFLRELQTDYLRSLMNIFNVYKAIIPRLRHLLEQESNSSIIDFCAGGGGSWERILPHLEDIQLKITLTDLYPNLRAFRRMKDRNPGVFDYPKLPVNAVQPPQELSGVRTFFNSFHHFKREDARSILENAVRDGEAIIIFEPMEKTVLQFFLNTISTLLMAFLITPFIMPFRIDRLIFTYLIPIVPLVTTFDGWISLLRLYSPRMLLELTNGLNEYEWEAGTARHQFGSVTFMTGRAKKKAE